MPAVTTFCAFFGCSGGGGSTVIIVTPTQGTTGNEQSPAADITLAIDAQQTIARVVVDASGNPITIPNNCRLVLCDEFESVITTLSPTITGSSYTAVIPRNVTTQQRTIFFALRVNDSTNAPIDHGTIEFTYVATGTLTALGILSHR